MGMLDKISGAVSSIKTSVSQKVDQAKSAVADVAAPAAKPSATGFSGVSSFTEGSAVAKASSAGFFGDLFGSKPEPLKPTIGPALKKAMDSLEKSTQSDTPEALRPGKADFSDADVPGTATRRRYDTGANKTTVRDGAFDSKVSLEETLAARAKTMGDQKAQVDRMSEKLKKPVSNPPTTEQAQEYFKAVAGKGTPKEVDEVKKEFGQYATNFYVHAGDGGGVVWGAKQDLVKDLDKAFADQPKLKDGRKIIDCEGYTAMAEKMLGPIQDPKTKQPMFELQHVKGDSHTMVGVFKKGEPKSPPFVINNNTVTDITPDQIKATKDDIKNLKGKPGDLDREAGHRLLMQRVFREAGNPGPSQSAPTYAETETKWRKAAGVD